MFCLMTDTETLTWVSTEYNEYNRHNYNLTSGFKIYIVMVADVEVIIHCKTGGAKAITASIALNVLERGCSTCKTTPL